MQTSQRVFPSLINHSPGALVKDREILYNVLLCQDLARGYHRHHISPWCMLKIDLQKVFDSIHWGFLEELLVALKFPKIFTQWLMTCVTSVRFNIHLNGRIYGSVAGGRGLRQGDPLSPLLFVLSMEYFSRLMQTTCTLPGFHFHPHCKPVRLTHLMFADNLILFCWVDVTSIQHIKNVLFRFSKVAGLQANLHKSQLILGGCCQQQSEQCLTAAELPLSHLPLKYLGVPITSCRLTKVECTGLVEKMVTKVHVWPRGICPSLA